MSTVPAMIPIQTINKKHTLTPLEQAFISSYIICKNGSQAVREAGYRVKAPEKYTKITSQVAGR